MATPIKERTIFVILGAITTLFLLINFNEQVGQIFLFMILLDFAIYYTDDFVSFPFESRTDDRTEAVLFSVVIYGIFLAISSVIAGVIAPQSFASIGNFANSVLAAQAATVPALSESVALTIFSWGILIPIIETRFFFGRLLEFFADQFKITLGLSASTITPTLAVASLISALFALFHLTAKTGAGNLALIVTFIFGVVSCLAVVYFKQTKQASGAHVVSNSIAVSAKYGYLDNIRGAFG